MNTKHPFTWLSASEQRVAFWAFLILTLALLITLNILDGALKTEASPDGIISFELAGKFSKAQNILQSWGEKSKIQAGISLGIDYLFLLSYAITIALACAMLAGRFTGRLKFFSSFGIIFAWSQFAAAILDAIENYALIRLLLGSQQASLPVVAYWCALPKFIIVGMGIAYILLAVAFINITKLWDYTLSSL